MGEKKGFYEQKLNSDDSFSRGFNYDLRAPTLKRETPGFLGFSDPVYRSFPDLDDLRSVSLSRSVQDVDLSQPLNRSLSSDLSRPVFRSLIDSAPSGFDVLPSPPDTYFPKKSFGISMPTSIFGDKPTSVLGDTGIKVQSSVPKELPIEPPPVPGNYLEPFYHLFSHAKPGALLDLIQQALLSLQKQKLIGYAIDMDINKKYKVKCSAYPLGEPKLKFVCSIFRVEPDEQGKRYALEFQRRAGSVIHFSAIWDKCKRIFQESGQFIADESSSPSNSKSIADFDDVPAETEIRHTLKCLLQMATSQCCDVKSQAVATLCKMSTEEHQKSLMIEEEGCIEAFIDAVSCPDEDIHRCAVSALANLAHSRDVCQKFAEKNGVKQLCTLSNSNTKEIVRSSLKALKLLAESLGSRILDDGCYRVFENHRNSSDPFTQQTAQSLIALSA